MIRKISAKSIAQVSPRPTILLKRIALSTRFPSPSRPTTSSSAFQNGRTLTTSRTSWLLPRPDQAPTCHPSLEGPRRRQGPTRSRHRSVLRRRLVRNPRRSSWRLMVSANHARIVSFCLVVLGCVTDVIQGTRHTSRKTTTLSNTPSRKDTVCSSMIVWVKAVPKVPVEKPRGSGKLTRAQGVRIYYPAEQTCRCPEGACQARQDRPIHQVHRHTLETRLDGLLARQLHHSRRDRCHA
jgi:hypothetical protein